MIGISPLPTQFPRGEQKKNYGHNFHSNLGRWGTSHFTRPSLAFLDPRQIPFSLLRMVWGGFCLKNNMTLNFFIIHLIPLIAQWLFTAKYYSISWYCKLRGFTSANPCKMQSFNFLLCSYILFYCLVSYQLQWCTSISIATKENSTLFCSMPTIKHTLCKKKLSQAYYLAHAKAHFSINRCNLLSLT